MSAASVITTQPKPVSTVTNDIAFADFGCYITIINNLRTPLNLILAKAIDGSWGPDPPNVILAGTTALLHLHDPSGPEGSEGNIIYQISETGSFPADLVSHFTCPYVADNQFDASIQGEGSGSFKVSYLTPSGSGHPFYITMTISYS